MVIMRVLAPVSSENWLVSPFYRELLSQSFIVSALLSADFALFPFTGVALRPLDNNWIIKFGQLGE